MWSGAFTRGPRRSGGRRGSDPRLHDDGPLALARPAVLDGHSAALVTRELLADRDALKVAPVGAEAGAAHPLAVGRDEPQRIELPVGKRAQVVEQDERGIAGR